MLRCGAFYPKQRKKGISFAQRDSGYFDGPRRLFEREGPPLSDGVARLIESKPESRHRMGVEPA